jgi:Tol biopolymer transport system component
LAFILTREPDWTTLPAGTPPSIRRLLRRCLEKDRKRRLADASDARLEIEEALAAPAPEGAATGSPTIARSFWKRAIPVVTTAVVTSAMVGAAVWMLKPTPPLAVTRFAFTLGENQQLSVGNQAVAMSPDGRLLVYVANDQLYLRSMSDLEARPIPGTRQTPTPYNPVFSPDGQFIAFYSQVDRTIKKIAVSGGAAVRIGPAPIELLGMTWDAGGIVFTGGLRESGNPVRIMRVSANGGQPDVLVKAKDLGEVMYGPQALPGGEWVLFSSTADFGNPDSWQIVVQSLKTGERKTLVTGGRDGRYLPTGHLVYAAGGVVFAVPFDVRHLAVTGGPVPVVEGVMRTSVIGAAQFSVSNTGSLAYMPGPMYGSSAQLDLALMDRKGGLTPLKLQPGAYAFPRVSPDGKQVAFGTDDGKEAIIWIYDLSGKSAMRRLTFGGRNRFPLWSSNGERVAFQSDREGDLGIFWQRADGSGTADRLTKPDAGTSHVPESWSPKGERFLFGAHKGPDISDPFGLNKGNVATDPFSLWMFSLQDKKATPFGQVQSFFPINSVFSPDSRWVAYTSGDEKGVIAIFVQPFPATGAKYQISKDPRSHHPLWSPDGKELYYIPGPVRSPLAVSVTTQPSFAFGNALPVFFPPGTAGPAVVRNYDMAPDGRAIGVVPAGQTTQSEALAAQQIQVVLNWTEELKRLVPTR